MGCGGAGPHHPATVYFQLRGQRRNLAEHMEASHRVCFKPSRGDIRVTPWDSDVSAAAAPKHCDHRARDDFAVSSRCAHATETTSSRRVGRVAKADLEVATAPRVRPNRGNLSLCGANLAKREIVLESDGADVGPSRRFCDSGLLTVTNSVSTVTSPRLRRDCP